jgi:drug/metabolite transporter (DMT)-like permease
MLTKMLPKSGLLNCVLFSLLALLWSASFINIKVVVAALPPVFCAMMRVLISLICLSVLFTLLRKKIFLPPSKAWSLWIAGFFTQAFPFAFLFFGEKFIAPALASIINSTVSIWALLLGTLIFRDLSQWTLAKVSGLILAFVGMVLIFQPFIRNSESSLLGILSVVGMAISYAIGSLINQHVIFKKMQVSFETNLIQQHVASVLFLLTTSLSLETWPSWSSVAEPKLLLSFLYLGVMATALAWMIYFYLIKEWGALRAATVMYIVPMLAILWDLLFLHLVPSQNELLGMFVILLSVTMIQWKRKVKIVANSNAIENFPLEKAAKNSAR